MSDKSVQLTIDPCAPGGTPDPALDPEFATEATIVTITCPVCNNCFSYIKPAFPDTWKITFECTTCRVMETCEGKAL